MEPLLLVIVSNISHFAGQVAPVTKLVNITPQVAPIILPHPPLKRKAAADPIALSGQRRKKIPQSAISDSLPQQRQNTPAITAPIHIPTSPLHVKWKGTCPVCKFGCRLSYIIISWIQNCLLIVRKIFWRTR